jgi:hypothetical protein
VTAIHTWVVRIFLVVRLAEDSFRVDRIPTYQIHHKRLRPGRPKPKKPWSQFQRATPRCTYMSSITASLVKSGSSSATRTSLIFQTRLDFLNGKCVEYLTESEGSVRQLV